jgi:hypothetical protein
MALHKLEILESGPYENGKTFGHTGAYTRIDALAHYRVDPANAANETIVDLDNAFTAEDGLVHFTGDVTILVPAQPDKANGAVLVEAPNRGNRIALRSFNMAPGDYSSTANIDPGDGFLLERGWCIVWCGWQWDVPRSKERIGLEPPLVDPQKLGQAAQMQLRIQPDMNRASLVLTDQHVGSIGHHKPIEAADLSDPAARLMVRDRLGDDGELIPRSQWCFARDEQGEALPDAGQIWLEGGFKAGRIYDVMYTPAQCPVVGAGLLAVRDMGAYLKHDASAPTAGMGKHFIVEGVSQCGRFLRTYLYFGLNVDERERPVYDGVLAHVAGARRGEFNHRYGQPSVQPTPSFGHLFPFADEPQTDPRTGRTEGLLDRQRRRGGLPKIVYTDTSSEYHRGDAALAHLDIATETDVKLPPEVRRYLFSGTQHGPGALPFARLSIFGTRTANDFNIIDYRPLFRAALQNLLIWIADGEEPPPSAYPRIADGTAMHRTQSHAQCAALPDFESPDADCLPCIRPIALGPRSSAGIGEFPATFEGAPYPDWVSALDADGNETAGVRMPDVSVPVGTHTGFNSRDGRTGGKGHYLEYLGATLAFPKNEDERSRNADTRASIAARYADRETYLAQVEQAAQKLVSERYLCPNDIPVCVRLAAVRYDGCMNREG